MYTSGIFINIDDEEMKFKMLIKGLDSLILGLSFLIYGVITLIVLMRNVNHILLK